LAHLFFLANSSFLFKILFKVVVVEAVETVETMADVSIEAGLAAF
jgi:hypothetical protein